jgi:hypothetical protein
VQILLAGALGSFEVGEAADAGASLPGYFEHKDEMSAAQYVDDVVAGRLTDPTLSFQIGHGFEVRGMLEDYLEDEADDGWAALIVWESG